MPSYTVCGLESRDTAALFVAAVYDGRLRALDGDDYVEARCGLSRWAEHVTAETPAEAERGARDIHRYDGQVHHVPASRAEPDDILVYDDGDSARIVDVSHTAHDDVHLTVYDPLTEQTSMACYDTSTLLNLARRRE